MTQEFEFVDELVELRKMVRRFCEEYSPESVVRTTMETDSGYDPALWSRLGSELGVLGLAIPEEYGGADVGLVAQAIVIEEFGAALLCGPVLGTLILAIPTLSALTDDSAKSEYLPSLVAGETTGTLAAPLDTGELDIAALTVTAQETERGWALNGLAPQVPDGATADLVIVAARTPSGVALFGVDGAAAGLSREPLHTLDRTRRQATLRFDGVIGRLLADESQAPDICDVAARMAAVLLAAEQVGGGQRMLDATVAYVTGRYQFGQSVGAFQAVKHRCANMLMELEQARSAAYHGAWALQEQTDDARLAASLAQATASEAYLWLSRSAIQLHGGLGFTWEGLPQLYFKRATTDSATLGRAEFHIERIAEFALVP